MVDQTAFEGATNGAEGTDTAALRAEIERLREDLSRLVEDVSTLARDRTRAAAEDVERWTNERADEFRQSVRAQPLTSCALSLAVGAILGAIFLRD